MGAITDQVHSLSDAISREKIAAFKAKRLAKKRATIKPGDDLAGGLVSPHTHTHTHTHTFCMHLNNLAAGSDIHERRNERDYEEGESAQNKNLSPAEHWKG